MYKMRNQCERVRIIYIANHSHFRIIRKMCEFINADPQIETTKPSGLCYFVVI